MKRYEHFFLEEFYFDEAFRKWVLKPTAEDNAFWEKWLSENEPKAGLIVQARELVMKLQPKSEPLPKREKDAAVQAIMHRLDTQFLSPSRKARPIFPRQLWVAAAACIALLIVAGLWAVYNRQPQSIRYQQLVATAGVPLRELVNNGTEPMLVRLADESLVSLDPGAKLNYPDQFSGARREVYLTGSASFEVVKNSNFPFYVYTDDVVTKVLGTEFRVRSVQGESNASVAVTSGKVAVFTRETIDLDDRPVIHELSGVLIEPNQQVSVSRDDASVTKTLVAAPQLVAAGIIPDEFDDEPVSAVFKILDKAYGIEIHFDEKLMKDCPVTATLAGLPFFEQLDLVCQAVGAKYSVADGQIIVSGEGCDAP